MIFPDRGHVVTVHDWLTYERLICLPAAVSGEFNPTTAPAYGVVVFGSVPAAREAVRDHFHPAT